MKKTLDWFLENPQVRKVYEEAALLELGESLRREQLQPLLCLDTGLIICGHRRYRAAKLVGLKELDVKIVEGEPTPTQIKVWQLQENILRENLKPFEEVDGVAEIAALNPDLAGKELADLLCISPVEVSKRLTISRCPLTYAALKDGRLKGMSDAYLLAKAPAEQKAALLAQRLSGEISRDGLNTKTRKPRQQGEKVSRLAISLPGGVSVTLAGREMDLEQAIEHLGECLKAARKARDERLSAKSWAQGMRDKAGKP